MEGVEGVGDSPYGVVAEDGGETAVALGAPDKGHRGVGTGGFEMRYGVAQMVGEHHIVEQELATVAGYRTANGDVVARAAMVVGRADAQAGEADRIECGVDCRSYSIDGYEIGGVAVVVHHTDDIGTSYVAVAQCPGVEHQVEVTDIVGTLVDRRQHNEEVVVFVGQLPIHTVVAVDAAGAVMPVVGATVVTIVGGKVVDTLPAGGEGLDVGGGV